ncbi:RecQ family ATP-dependent DNA helicase [Pseudomonadales bacterium]|nr:RecQ family ATP-dependent DNA helicase [Pseudomonadales bacterium]
MQKRALEILQGSLGKAEARFHEHQWEAISTLVEQRRRLLVVQRTGWGKSAVYFIATKLMRDQGFGPTIIISPLLALMRNQIESAAKYGVRLGTINSSNSVGENKSTVNAVVNGGLDAIIISPEQLAKPNFNDAVLDKIADKVGLFVIDEAHCISDWGHDFRPDYKRIVNILKFLPVNMPVLATTATANQRVMDDVCAQLGDGIQVLRGELTRESLHLQTIAFAHRSQRLAWLAETLPQLAGTGIIYTATTRDAEQVTTWLKGQGIKVEAYYGTLEGMTSEESTSARLAREDMLLNNEVKALVATSALGMGYDKPDLSFVIHYQSPGSVVSYYQQVGRAGRAIPKAYGVLLAGSEDDSIQQFFIQQAFPQEQLVNEILTVLDDADEPMKTNEILRSINARKSRVEAALKFLLAESPAPVMIEQQPIRYSRTVIDYQMPHEAIKRLSESKQREWQTMQTYAEHTECLMNFLAIELGDKPMAPCGRCANCDPDGALGTTYSHEIGQKAADFLENMQIVIDPRKQVDPMNFPLDQLPRSLVKAGLVAEHGRALCSWGGAGWGEVAMQWKHSGKLAPRLVAAAAQMIQQRWQPYPAPTWVTYVPSLRKPRLVAEFAEQLAAQLGLQCIDAVSKQKNNKMQKMMENSDYQCRNLDGVFHINGAVPDGPVLLVDDAVDSKWTFTVIAALLLRAGSGRVLPFAVVSTASSS